MRIVIWLLLVVVGGWEGQAQLLYTFDSVEVHRIDTMYFQFGSSDLEVDAVAVLDSLASDYRPGLQVYLEGHTDAVGSAYANERLGNARANACGLYLRKSNDNIRTKHNGESFAGWPEEDIELRSFGEKELLINTLRRERRNRRVLVRSGVPRTYARVRGRVTDEDGQALAGLIIAHGRYMRDSTQAGSDGYYEVNLPLEQVVGIDVYAPGHLFHTQMMRIDTNRVIPSLNVQLQTALPGRSMDIPDLYFHGNKAVLVERSKGALPRVLTFLRFNPGVRVEIAGHVNHPGQRIGPGSWQWDLSEARSEKVREYLIENGIAADRLVAKGYSNYHMRYPRPRNLREQEANRRVEIKILE